MFVKNLTKGNGALAVEPEYFFTWLKQQEVGDEVDLYLCVKNQHIILNITKKSPNELDVHFKFKNKKRR